MSYATTSPPLKLGLFGVVPCGWYGPGQLYCSLDILFIFPSSPVMIFIILSIALESPTDMNFNIVNTPTPVLKWNSKDIDNLSLVGLFQT